MPQKKASRHPLQLRFSFALMMTVMSILSVAAAAGYYLVQSLEHPGSSKLVFILFTLVAPVAVVVVVSVIVSLKRLWSRK